MNILSGILYSLILITGVIGKPAFSQNIAGAYKKSTGNTLVITPIPKSQNYHLIEYETGFRYMLKPIAENQFEIANRGMLVEIKQGEIRAISTSGNQGNWTAMKIPLPEKFITFSSGDVNLYGKLVLPLNIMNPPVVIIAHGSDNDSAVDGYDEPYIFASQGIASFVYDKRGTGKSGGKAILSFPQLAADLLAAINVISERAEVDSSRMGLSGYSQGGWIAPLAASQSDKVKFVVVNYGMTMSIAQEDWYETPLKLKVMGIQDDKSMAELKELNLTLHREIKDDFKEGWYERIENKIAAYKGSPWLDSLKKIPTTWLGSWLNMDKETKTQLGPTIMRTVDPFYDPMTTLRKLNIPMYWLIAAEDIEAPPKITINDISTLKLEGKPFDLKVYPDTDHGMVKFRTEKNKRIYSHYTETYLMDKIKWVHEKTK